MSHLCCWCCAVCAIRWGLGPYAAKKKQLIAEGKLDKYGRPNENTPAEYLRALPDLQKQAAAAAAEPAAATPAAKAAADSSGDEEMADAGAENGEVGTEEKKKKKDKSAKKEKVRGQRLCVRAAWGVLLCGFGRPCLCLSLLRKSVLIAGHGRCCSTLRLHIDENDGARLSAVAVGAWCLNHMANAAQCRCSVGPNWA